MGKAGTAEGETTYILVLLLQLGGLLGGVQDAGGFSYSTEERTTVLHQIAQDDARPSAISQLGGLLGGGVKATRGKQSEDT